MVHTDADVRIQEKVTLSEPVIPKEILKLDARSLQIYKDALQNGKVKVYNIRVMVVGQHRVGKTTLTKRLLRRDVNISQTKSTNGIDVHVQLCRVSLETGQWTPQHHDTGNYAGLQHLVKLFNECSKKSNSSRKPDRHQNVTNKKHNESTCLNQENKSTITESGIKRKSTGLHQENLSGINGNIKSAYSNNVVMEILQLVHKNADKLEKNMIEFATLGIWDFAGQYIFYSTHQAFLTRRAVYLLVTDLSQQVTDVVSDDLHFFDCDGIKSHTVYDLVEVWMNSIHTCAQDSENCLRTPPVILVATHADRIPECSRENVAAAYFNLIRTGLEDKPTRYHLADKDFVIDNTICDPQTEALKSKIIELAMEQAYWGEEVPAKWFALEQVLMRFKALGIKVIPFSLIEKLNKAGSVQIETKEELVLFLKFEHEMGMIIYFSAEGLGDKIVLEPQWLINALNSLITAKKFIQMTNPACIPLWSEFEKRGKLTPQLIDSLWTKEKNQEFHDNKEHIILLMEKLNIIARPTSYSEDGKTIKEENYFLAPCMLKEITPRDVIYPQPDSEMGSSSVLCYLFTGKFLPPPVFHRLLATCVAHWPVAKQKMENLIYCGCCVFDIDIDSSHRLILHHKDHVIFARVTRWGITDKIPALQHCIKVKDFIGRELSRIIGYLSQSLQYELHILCPNSNGNSPDIFIPLLQLQKNSEVTCHSHKSHVIVSKNLIKFWFEDLEQPEKYNTCAVTSESTYSRQSGGPVSSQFLPHNVWEREPSRTSRYFAEYQTGSSYLTGAWGPEAQYSAISRPSHVDEVQDWSPRSQDLYKGSLGYKGDPIDFHLHSKYCDSYTRQMEEAQNMSKMGTIVTPLQAHSHISTYYITDEAMALNSCTTQRHHISQLTSLAGPSGNYYQYPYNTAESYSNNSPNQTVNNESVTARQMRIQNSRTEKDPHPPTERREIGSSPTLMMTKPQVIDPRMVHPNFHPSLVTPSVVLAQSQMVNQEDSRTMSSDRVPPHLLQPHNIASPMDENNSWTMGHRASLGPSSGIHPQFDHRHSSSQGPASWPSINEGTGPFVITNILPTSSDGRRYNHPSASSGTDQAHEVHQQYHGNTSYYQHHQPTSPAADRGHWKREQLNQRPDNFPPSWQQSAKTMTSSPFQHVEKLKRSLNENSAAYDKVTPVSGCLFYPYGTSLGNMKAQFDETDAVCNLRMLVELAKSVGIIKSPNGICGTGFRVGSEYIMTAKHVKDDILNAVPGQFKEQSSSSRINLLSETFINFSCEVHGNSDDSNDLKFNFNPEIVYENECMDTVILRLKSDGHKQYPPPLTFARLSNPCGQLYFIGHSGADIKKTDKFRCVQLVNEQKTAAEEWSLKHVGRYGFNELDNPNRLLFHCTFEKGASGSPGVWIYHKNQQTYAKVVTMLLCGYPDWYYDKNCPQEKKNGVPHHFCVEQGVCISSLYEDMKVTKPDLTVELFT